MGEKKYKPIHITEYRYYTSIPPRHYGNYWIKQEAGASLRLGHILDGFHAISSLCLNNYIL